VIQDRKGFTILIFGAFLLSCGPYVYWSMTGTKPPAFVEAAKERLFGKPGEPGLPAEKRVMLEKIQGKISEANDAESRVILLSEEEASACYEARRWKSALDEAKNAESRMTAGIYYKDAARKCEAASAAGKVLLGKRKSLSDEASRMISAYERRFGAAAPGKEK